MDATPFDRAAEIYDETRGGEDRGGAYAEQLNRFLAPGASVLEIGVGTALVAALLGAFGHTVVGVDLSRPMLARAARRVERNVFVEANATVLPVADRSFDAVTAIWAIHVVGDVDSLMVELRRVLRPGGLLLHVAATPTVNSNDLHDLSFTLGPKLGRTWDRSETFAPRALAHGFALDATVAIDDDRFEISAKEQAAHMEQRVSSSLWELDDEAWEAIVQPIINRLRALPEPDRPRRCRYTHELACYRLGSKP